VLKAVGSLWMCSKNANLGIDIASAISDYITESQAKELPSKEQTTTINHILKIMVRACKSLMGVKLSVDSFFIGIVEGLLRDLDLAPAGLITRLEICERKILAKTKRDDECLKILRSIAMNAILVASMPLELTPFGLLGG